MTMTMTVTFLSLAIIKFNVLRRKDLETPVSSSTTLTHSPEQVAQ